LASNSQMQIFCNELKAAKALNQTIAESTAYLVRLAKLKRNFEIKNTVSFSTKWKQVVKLYPMLNFVSTRYSYDERSNEVKHCIEYIKMIDEKIEFEKISKEEYKAELLLEEINVN